MVRTRVVVTLSVVLSLASAGVAIVPSLAKDKPAAQNISLSTPVFSVRRAPGTIVRTIADGKLQTDLQNVLSQPLFAGVRPATCLAVRDADGRPLYGLQTAAPLIPASNMKLLTATVALDKMGPDSRYTTPVRSTAPSGADGSIGDLWLVGSGDPLLATADFASVAGWMESPRPFTSLEGLADRVYNAGVRKVGRVIGDESRYDRQRYLPTWEPNYATDPDIGPQSALALNGGFAQWRPRAIPAAAPATQAATVFADLLRGRGIAVGGVGEGPAPAQGVTLASIDSLPLSDIVGVMLRDSDNLIAELLVKELGVRFGSAGTTAAGIGVVRAGAASLGLPIAPLASADGSGLDRSDRMSCDLLEAVLTRSGTDSPLAAGLPVAGTSGTLTRRFTSTPAAGKVRAKTGSLEGVAALSGWTTGHDGRPVQFSLVANDLPNEAAGVTLQNQVVTALAAYPDAPTADELAPGPIRPRPG